MVGTEDIARFADLLRVSAETARMIADNVKSVDAVRMRAVVRLTEAAAAELDVIRKTSNITPLHRVK